MSDGNGDQNTTDKTEHYCSSEDPCPLAEEPRDVLFCNRKLGRRHLGYTIKRDVFLYQVLNIDALMAFCRRSPLRILPKSKEYGSCDCRDDQRRYQEEQRGDGRAGRWYEKEDHQRLSTL